MPFILQMVVPNKVGIYGSQYIFIKLGNISKKKLQKISISRSHLKALDQPSEYCDNGVQTLSTSACIAQFTEKHLECSTKIHGMFSANMTCNETSQLMRFANISIEFEEADANAVYEKTGCLASCEKDEYNPIVADKMTEVMKEPYDTRLDFRMMAGSYQEMEQYLLYDSDSFIADVGGFMGLLLGFSVLSIYNEIVDTLLDKCKLVGIFGKTQTREMTKENRESLASSASIRGWLLKQTSSLN